MIKTTAPQCGDDNEVDIDLSYAPGESSFDFRCEDGATPRQLGPSGEVYCTVDPAAMNKIVAVCPSSITKTINSENFTFNVTGTIQGEVFCPPNADPNECNTLNPSTGHPYFGWTREPKCEVHEMESTHTWCAATDDTDFQVSTI